MTRLPLRLLLLLAALRTTPLAAAPADDLRNVQRAIGETQNRLQQQQRQQRSLQNDIRQTQTELEAARRELDSLTRRRQSVWREVQTLQSKLEGLQTRISGTQAQVARLLDSRYRNRQPNAVTLFLQNADPQQKGRYLEYMRYLNQANDRALDELRQSQSEAKQQQEAVNRQLRELDELKRRQQTAAARLGREQQTQQQQSRQLEQNISRETAKLNELRANERRLNGVVAAITRRSAQQRAATAERQRAAQAQRQREAEQRRQAEERRRQQAQNNRRNDPQSSPPPPAKTEPQGNLTAEDLNLQAPAAEAAETSNRFSRLQGSLRRPVSGSVAGRFGQNRPGGGTWKGLFISTPPATVHSVAEGQVAYAAPLQGYGNTVIIDHGDGYLSIYTGLSQISTGNGSQVSARQPIGRSGSLPDSGNGLYFEIRYRNQAMNPASWVN